MCNDNCAIYARIGQKPRYCGPCCVGKNMINVKNPKCPCGKIPSYGFPDGPRVCCKECKKPGMIDVVHNKCPCGKQMNFGVPDGKAECCSECKKPGMVNVVNKKCPCGKHPHFGFPGEPRVCCFECKKPGMIDVVNKMCPGYDGVPCPVATYIHNSREYCLACDPDDSRRTTRLKDERAFFDFLAENDVSVTQRSYRIDYQCIDTAKKYSEIDGVIITADVVVCLELDEDAHENYDPVCEEARMNDASAELKIAFPDRPIAWIRVNPHIKKDGRRDVSRAAKKVRDERHRKALILIRDVLENPRDCIEYVGY